MVMHASVHETRETGVKVPISSRYNPTRDRFENRKADGSMACYMPIPSADDEAIQGALLGAGKVKVAPVPKIVVALVLAALAATLPWGLV